MGAVYAIGMDLVLILILVFGIYFPRHQRRDLVVAFLAVNVGVLAVAMSLASNNVGIGLGMGLFGVLSIIRLRSTELDQRAVAYYFASLALGLICGLATTISPSLIAVAGLIVAVLYIGDHPRILAHRHSMTLTLDQAIADEAGVREVLAHRVDGQITKVVIDNVNYVNDTTMATVQFRTLASRDVRQRTKASAPGRSTSNHREISRREGSTQQVGSAQEVGSAQARSGSPATASSPRDGRGLSRGEETGVRLGPRSASTSTPAAS